MTPLVDGMLQIVFGVWVQALRLGYSPTYGKMWGTSSQRKNSPTWPKIGQNLAVAFESFAPRAAGPLQRTLPVVLTFIRENMSLNHKSG